MIAIRNEKKDMSQYEIPRDARRRAPGLVAFLHGEETDICKLWAVDGTEACAVSGTPTCYVLGSSKDFRQVSSYGECALYRCVEQSAKQSAYEMPLGDSWRTFR